MTTKPPSNGPTGPMETLLKETRTIPPPPEFSENAHLGDRPAVQKLRASAAKDPVAFWEQAASEIHWFRKWSETLVWKEPFADWFVGGRTNAAYNCLDRHLEKSGDKTALVFESENGSVERISYRELFERVCRCANVLEKECGLKAGDTAALYLPLIPEAVVAMLACARIGVTHTVIFAGFTHTAIRDRLQDAGCRVIITADFSSRRGQKLDLKATVDKAVAESPAVEHVLVLRRDPKTPLGPRDRDWVELCARQKPTHEAPSLSASHPLFILYTSGTTGKPKGIVHSTGGYLVGCLRTARWVFDVKPEDVYWCTADIGWITGHSYLVYGILGLGMTAVIFEGALNHPSPDRIWEMVQRHRVTVLYTAPTALRSLMRGGQVPCEQFNLGSLRLLGSVGEPINPEAWMWYHKNVGEGRCPIVDTWWQTETGSMLITPLPGVTPLKPGSATLPFPGILADVVDEKGQPCPPNQGGYLVIRHPWPAMLKTIFKDPGRLKDQYWSRFPGMYFTGDGAHKDEDGYFWIKGRIDDVINVSGHRLGTMEIESALVSHAWVAEAAVVGRPDDLKGQAVVAFVIPKEKALLLDPKDVITALKKHVANEIGAIARPEEILITRTLPKTRSGKIMRRLLKDLAAGKTGSGDTTTLENPELVDVVAKG